MNIGNIWKKITKKYPLKNAEKWDFVGHQVGHWKQNVTKMMFVLDVTNDAIDFAIKNKCQLIISYHSFFFGKRKEILETNKIKFRMYQKLKKFKIGVYSIHTAIDNSSSSLASYILNLLGFKKIENLVLSFAKAGEHQSGFSNQQIINKCCKLFLTKQVIIINSLPKRINKVVLANGAHDKEIIDLTKEVKGDLLICGEMNYHTKLYARESKTPTLIVGHFMEWLFQKKMKQEFNSIIGIEIVEYKEENFIKFKGENNG